jgi:hypothetical protein
MSKNSNEHDSRNDEIDLLELFRRIGRTLSKWFRALGTGFLVVVVFFIRNIIPLIFSIIIGVGISYLIKWTTKPVYLSEITLRSNTIPNADMISYFNRLSIFIRQKNFSELSASLSITPEKAAGIKKIEGFWVVDKNRDLIPDYVDYKNKYNVYDTINLRMQDRFVVDVMLSDPKLFKEISEGLIKYTRKNSFFQERNDLRLRNTDELLIRLNYDIEQLDSLQKVKYFEETRNRIPERGGQMVFLQEQKTQLVYEDIYKLYQRKQSLDEQKEVYPDIVTLLADFYQPVRRYNGGTYYGIVVIPAIFGLTLIYLIIKRNRKKIKEIFNKY